MCDRRGCLRSLVHLLILIQPPVRGTMLWSLAKSILTGILSKPIKCQLLPNLTIRLVRFRPLMTFHEPYAAVQLWRSASMPWADVSFPALLGTFPYFVQVFLCVTMCCGTSLPSASAEASKKNRIMEPNS
jgi:hypothetical protein